MAVPSEAVQGDAPSWPRRPHRRRSSRPGSGSPPRRLRARSTNQRARAATCGPRWPPSRSPRRRSTSPSRPTHWPEDWRHGLAFAVMGWAQLGLGVILITRPRRWALVAGIVGNLAIIGVWAVSRTVGLPDILGGDGDVRGRRQRRPPRHRARRDDRAGLGRVAGRARARPPAHRRRPHRQRAGRQRDHARPGRRDASASTPRPRATATPPAGSGHHDAAETEGHGEEAAADHHAAGGADRPQRSRRRPMVPAGARRRRTRPVAHGVAVPWEAGESPCEKATKGQDPEESNTGEGHNHHGPLEQKAISAEDQAKLIEEQKLARSVDRRSTRRSPTPRPTATRSPPTTSRASAPTTRRSRWSRSSIRRLRPSSSSTAPSPTRRSSASAT